MERLGRSGSHQKGIPFQEEQLHPRSSADSPRGPLTGHQSTEVTWQEPTNCPISHHQFSLKCTSNTSASAVESLALCGHTLQVILEVIRDRQQSLPCLDHTTAVPSYIPSLFVLLHSQLPLWLSSLSSSFSFPFCSAPLVVGWQGTVGSQLPRFHSLSLAFSVGGTHYQTHKHLPIELR